MGDQDECPVMDNCLNQEITPTYPLEYFIANNFQKPPILLPPVAETVKKASAGVKLMITTNSKPTLDDVKVFLRTTMASMKEKCPENWASLGVRIAGKDESIGPLDLFTIEQKPVGPVTSDGDGFEDSEILYALILIAGCYRISLVKDDQHKTRIEQLINEQVVAAGGGPNLATKCLPVLIPFYNDEELLKMFAGLDMFLNRFYENPYARVRVGTIVTRYRDCSALLTLSYITDMVGFHVTDFARWLFVPELGKQYKRILMSGQDHVNDHAYTPYLTCMKLSEESPYSTSMNPEMHLFAHTIGCAMMLNRSINAAFIPCNNQTAVLENAFLFYYAQRRCLGHVPPFYTRKEEPEVQKLLKCLEVISRNTASSVKPSDESATVDNGVPIDVVGALLPNEPDSRDGLAWFNWLADWNLRTPVEIPQIVYQRFMAIENPHENTMGEQLRQIAFAEFRDWPALEE